MAIQNTFYLDVDIKRDNYVDEPKVTQNDAVTFVLRMTDDGVDYPLTGVSTYTLASLRPDGQSVLTVGALTGDNEITFELGSTEVSVPGNVKAAIQLYDVDGRVSSIPFTYEVTKDIAVDYIPSAEEETLIQLVLGEGPAILNAAELVTAEANEFLANNVRVGEYDIATAYEEGNEVGYDGSSYVALGPTQGNLPTDTAFWALRARKGQGDVNSVNGVLPDASGDVTIPAPDLSGLATKTELHATMLVNVSSYGALGNGTDDTTVIQNLINTVPDGTTIIGDGKTYNVTGLDIERSNIKIKDLNLKMRDGDNFWKSPIRIIGTWDSPVSNIELENLQIDGNRKNQTNIRTIDGDTSENRGGIALHGVISNVTIRRCIVKHTAGDGIWLTAGHIEVTGTWQVRDDTQLCISNVKVYDSIFTFNRRHGGALDSCYDVVFENCIFDNNGTNINGGTTDGDKGELFGGALYGMGFDAESMLSGANFRDIRFTNCSFQNNAGIALALMSTADDLTYEPFVQLKDIIIEKCTFSGYSLSSGSHTSLSISPLAHNKTLARKLFSNIKVLDCTFKLGAMSMASAENVFLDNLHFEDSAVLSPTVLNFNSCDNVIMSNIPTGYQRLYSDGGGTIISPPEWYMRYDRRIYSVTGYNDLSSITTPVAGDIAINNSPSSYGIRSWIYTGGSWSINSSNLNLKTGTFPGISITRWLEYTDSTGALAGYIPVYTN